MRFENKVLASIYFRCCSLFASTIFGSLSLTVMSCTRESCNMTSSGSDSSSCPPRNFPRGFLWLSIKNAALIKLHNYCADQSVALCEAAMEAGAVFGMEHPENLGLVQGQLPGTIWDFPRMISLRSSFNVQNWGIVSMPFWCHLQDADTFCFQCSFP